MKNKSIYYILISFIIIPFLLIGCATEEQKDYPQAENGVLDLREWNFESDGVFKLKGEWEFYYNEILKGEDFNKKDILDKRKIVRVPGSWSNGDDGLSNQGFGTYRLKVLLKDNSDILGLKINSLMTAHRLYINDELVGRQGVVGDNKNNSTPFIDPYTVILNSDKNSCEIVIHISNFNHRKSGIWYGPLIGNYDDIQDINKGKLGFELFLIGSIFVMGFYNLNLFIFRKRERAALYFSLVCFGIVLRVMVTGEKYITQVLPNISWEFMIKVEYLTIYLGLIFYIMFIGCIYPKVFSRNITKITMGILILLSSIVLFADPNVFSYTLDGFQIVFVVYVCYSFGIILKNVIKYKDESIMLFIGLVVAFITGINDMFYNNRVIDTGYLLPLGVFVLILSHSLMLVRRFANTLNKSEKLARENEDMLLKIQQMNRNLEKKVNERTKELTLKNQQLRDAVITDGLTKLFNHNYIYARLEEEIDIAKDLNKKLSIIMLDLDNFKSINDTYGHPEGDRILKVVSRAIRNSVRNKDLIGRYGGEEFLVILIDTALDEAFDIGERIRENINKLKIKDIETKFSISGGVAELRDENVKSIVKRADKLLYESKGSGKNKISK